MTTTPTQQPEALRLADTLDQVAALFSFPAALLLSAAELRRQHAEIARLTAENEALREQLENSRKAHDTSGFVNAMQYAHGIGEKP